MTTEGMYEVAQQDDNALSQRRAAYKTEKPAPDFYLPEPEYFSREISLDYEQWRSIAETRLPWYEYNHSSYDRNRKDAINRIVVPHVWGIISSGLSERQKEVVELYFLFQLNQVSIAKKLGISQPTVSQHLNGKRRNGKKIGGSIKRIKKLIRKMASAQNTNSNELNLIGLLSQLLDKRTGYRKSSALLRSILK